MQVASRVMELVNSYNPDAVFIDGTGIGCGVLDRLNQLGCPNATGVDFGSRADRTDARDAAARYANRRAEMSGSINECRLSPRTAWPIPAWVRSRPAVPHANRSSWPKATRNSSPITTAPDGAHN